MSPHPFARLSRRVRGRACARRDDGVVAIVTALLMVVFLSLCAFSIDVANWYLVGEQQQRAVDAAALAGVVSLPGDPTTASSVAQRFSTINGFAPSSTVSVTSGVDAKPTQLRVTVSSKVKNMFGGLLGTPTTTVSRTAVADYAGPVVMGSPCNEFGNDPDATSLVRANTCNSTAGQLWANVSSPKSAKANGDAYQSTVCALSVDGCAGGVNTDYDQDGYFYTVSVRSPISKLVVDLYDPEFANVGLTCDSTTLDSATSARNDYVSDAPSRYAKGADNANCTGDSIYSGSTTMNTQFTVRAPGRSYWDPLTFPAVAGCQKVYGGYNGSLSAALNKGNKKYNDSIAQTFRRWSTLCTISTPVVGDYLIQVKTQGIGTDNADAGNRFAIRAYGDTDSDAAKVSVAGREKMGIYSNKPGATTEFYLARVPTTSAGMSLNVRLFDVGDSTKSGDIAISSPPGSGVTFENCVAAGPISGTLKTCELNNVSSGTHNGKWQQVSVPIPPAYRCTDSDPTSCWVRLTYRYRSGSAPTDVTAWTASIEGDPVRLIR